jgi:hypothetical protein
MNDDNQQIAEELGHEPLAIPVRAVVGAVVVLLVLVVSSLLIIGGLTMVLANTEGGEATVLDEDAPAALPAGVPSVDSNQVGTLRRLDEREERWLAGYAWVDRDAGVARIPIQRAMKILAEQPLATRNGADE